MMERCDRATVGSRYRELRAIVPACAQGLTTLVPVPEVPSYFADLHNRLVRSVMV
jgi:hypothetical protein